MKYLYQNKHWSVNKEYDIDKLLYLMIDRPNIINGYFDFIWQNNKRQYHRDYDLPAYIYKDNDNDIVHDLHWRKDGELHRINNKPAFVDGADGYKLYYINGELIKRD